MAASAEDLSLVTLAQTILDGVVDAYGAKGITLPDRQYYTIGTPANDCEQLVVAWQQSYVGLPGDEASLPQQCNDTPKTAVFSVQLCREVPVVSDSGKAPTAAAIQDRSKLLLTDAWVLLNAVGAIDPYGLGVIATVDVVEVSGGLGCIQVQTVLAVP